MRDSSPERTPEAGRRSLWCRLGLHRWAVFTQHKQRLKDGAWVDITKNRCEREGCKYFWWSTYDVSLSRHQGPY
jgi:hypothetical protein